MIEVKKLHEEIASFLKKDFDVNEVHVDGDELDAEIVFQLKSDCDGTKIKGELRKHFGESLKFHSTEMGGLLAILIEDY